MWGGQFCDRGPSYHIAIFANEAQESWVAKAAIKPNQAALNQEIVTPILEAATFYDA